MRCTPARGRVSRPLRTGGHHARVRGVRPCGPNVRISICLECGVVSTGTAPRACPRRFSHVYTLYRLPNRTACELRPRTKEHITNIPRVSPREASPLARESSD
eukprot:3047508-Prymnesium_polylepis.1